MSRPTSAPGPRRDGNVVVAVAVGAVLFMSLLALVIDVGNWYGERVRVQALADLAVEAALRRHPEAPAGDPARATCLGVFHTNGVAPEVLGLRRAASGDLRLEVVVAQERWFSAAAGLGGVRLRVQARARRDPAGRVFLVP